LLVIAGNAGALLVGNTRYRTAIRRQVPPKAGKRPPDLL